MTVRGGVRGGEVVAVEGSYTGQYLKPTLERQREAAEYLVGLIGKRCS